MTEASNAKKGGLHYAWVIMIACCFIQAGQLGIIMNCGGIFLQPVSSSIGCGRGDLAIYMTLQAWALALTMPLVGKWLPTKNINVLMTGAAVIDGCAFALMSQLTAPWMWWIDAIVIGCASAFLFFAPVPMMIQNWFAKKKGLALGIATCFSGIGGAILSPILSSLIASAGWHTAYIVGGVVSMVLTIPFTAFVIKFKPADKGMLPYGAEEGAAQAANPAKKQDAPIERGISTQLGWKSGIIFIVFFIGGFMSLATSFTNHLPGLASSLGYASAAIGLLASCNMIGNMVGKLVLGPLSDKIGVKKSVAVGYVVVFVGLALVLLGGGNTFALYLGAAFYGVGFSVATLFLPLIVAEIVGKRDYPKIYSYATSGNAFIGSLGITICGFCFDFTGSYFGALAFIVVALIIAVLLIVAGYVRSKHVMPIADAEYEELTGKQAAE